MLSKPKYVIALETLLQRQQEGLTTLEALNIYGDTCLHSTISDLCNNRDLGFKKVSEEHTHQGGGKVTFTRYWLLPQSVGKAKHILSGFNHKDENYKNKKAPVKTEAKKIAEIQPVSSQLEVKV